MNEGFPFIDIIFFALVAVFLVLRLRNVLGRRTGHEKHPPEDIFNRDAPEEPGAEKGDQGDNVIPLLETKGKVKADLDDAASASESASLTEKIVASDSLRAGFDEIRTLDPGFHANDLLHGAASAFEMIVAAFAAGDDKVLGSLLNEDVFDDFSAALKARQEAGEAQETTLIGIKEGEIIEAGIEGDMAVVTIKFTSEQVNVTRDAEGEVIGGDVDHITQVIDLWTFGRDTRSRDPNWTLQATNSPN